MRVSGPTGSTSPSPSVRRCRPRRDVLAAAVVLACPLFRRLCRSLLRPCSSSSTRPFACSLSSRPSPAASSSQQRLCLRRVRLPLNCPLPLHTTTHANSQNAPPAVPLKCMLEANAPPAKRSASQMYAAAIYRHQWRSYDPGKRRAIEKEKGDAKRVDGPSSYGSALLSNVAIARSSVSVAVGPPSCERDTGGTAAEQR